MKTKLTILCVVALMGFMLTSPASAGNIGPNAVGGGNISALPPACGFSGSPAYCNGAINGTTDAWTINSGFSVSDSFTIASGTTLSSAQIATWLFPGDTMSSVDWAIGTSFFGSQVASGTAATTNTFLFSNQFGYNIYNDTFSLGSVALSPGTYYLTLQNAVIPSGDPAYWDENSGPSLAEESSVGTIPSEAFALYGSGGGGAPEPGTLVLGGSGLLLLAGALRRKLSR